MLLRIALNNLHSIRKENPHVHHKLNEIQTRNNVSREWSQPKYMPRKNKFTIVSRRPFAHIYRQNGIKEGVSVAGRDRSLFQGHRKRT